MMRFSPWAVVRHQSLCTGNALQAFLEQSTHGKTFVDSAIDLKIIAADLLTEREFLFSRQTTPNVPIAMAARASASIPIVFPPVACAGALLVDGAHATTCRRATLPSTTCRGSGSIWYRMTRRFARATMVCARWRRGSLT